MAKKNRSRIVLSLWFTAALAAMTAIPAPAQPAGEVVISAVRREPLIMPVIDLFKKATGIKVTLKSGEDQALAQVVRRERPTPLADVYLTRDSGQLEFLRLKAALQTYSSDATLKIPERFRAADGS